MTAKFKTLDDAIELARYAHRHQTDKAGLPYFEHPKRVMKSVQAQGGLPYVQMGAILHDVTEDTAFTCQMLLDLGFPEGAVEIVRLVDRDYSRKQFHLANPGYEGAYHGGQHGIEVDEFYYAGIKANPGALMVKLADINDNLQEWRLSYLPVETQKRLRQKYAAAKHLLGVWVDGITNNPRHPLHKDNAPVHEVKIDPKDVVSIPLDVTSIRLDTP